MDQSHFIRPRWVNNITQHSKAGAEYWEYWIYSTYISSSNCRFGVFNGLTAWLPWKQTSKNTIRLPGNGYPLKQQVSMKRWLLLTQSFVTCHFLCLSLEMLQIQSVLFSSVLVLGSSSLLTGNHYEPLTLLDSSEPLMALRCSPSYLRVTAVVKQWGSVPRKGSCHTLTHVHMRAVRWKGRKLRGTRYLAAADGLCYSWSTAAADCPSGTASGKAKSNTTKLANRKSSHRSSPFSCVGSIHDFTAFTPSHSRVTHTAAHTIFTALTCLSVYIWNVATRRWKRADYFKNILERRESTEDFCAQVHGKVI